MSLVLQKSFTNNLILEYISSRHTQHQQQRHRHIIMNEVWNLVLFQFLCLSFDSTQSFERKREKEEPISLYKENDECLQSGWLICYLFFFLDGHAKRSKSISFTNLNKSFFNKAPFSFHLNRHHICQQVQWWNILPLFVRSMSKIRRLFSIKRV